MAFGPENELGMGVSRSRCTGACEGGGATDGGRTLGRCPRTLGGGALSARCAMLESIVGASDADAEAGLGNEGGGFDSRNGCGAACSSRDDEMGGGTEVVFSSSSGGNETASRSSIESIVSGEELKSSVLFDGAWLLRGGSVVTSLIECRGMGDGRLRPKYAGRSLTGRCDDGETDRDEPESRRDDSTPSGLEIGRAEGTFDETGGLAGTELRSGTGGGLLGKLG